MPLHATHAAFCLVLAGIVRANILKLLSRNDWAGTTNPWVRGSNPLGRIENKELRPPRWRPFSFESVCVPLHATRGTLSTGRRRSAHVCLRGCQQGWKLIYSLAVRAWNEVSVDVDGHLDRCVAQLIADVGWALASHQED